MKTYSVILSKAKDLATMVVLSRCFAALNMTILLMLTSCQKSQVCQDYQVSPWPLKSHTGFILETDHYRIFTTVKDKDFHTAAVVLAEEQYGRFSESLQIVPKEKMIVYIFSDVNQWMAFTQAKFGERACEYTMIRNGGYTAKNFAAFYYMGRYSTLTILAHELFHLYVNLASCPEPIPAWLNEGMSSYFEAHEWDRCKPVFTPKKNLFRRQNLLEAVSQEKLFPLRQLLTTNAGEICKLPQQRVLIYYAQLWALVEYLQDPCSAEYHVNFQYMLSELGTRQMALKAKGYLAATPEKEKVSFGEAVFRQYITDDLEKFEKDFNCYLPSLIGWE